MSKKSIKKKKNSGTANCDICGEANFLQEHHIRGRDVPNPNQRNNLTCICPNCHTKVHMGEIIIEGYVMSTEGLELIWRTKEKDSVYGNDAKVHLFKKN